MIIRRRAAGGSQGRRLATLVLAAWLSAAVLPVPATADGAGTRGLTLRVTVNTRPGLEAVHRGIRAGAPVVKTYRLRNRGGADLYDVHVDDPGLPGVTIRCPGGRPRVRLLRGMSTMTCTATTAARPGTWQGTVRASGRIPYLRAEAAATARSGYTGIAGALALSETAAVDGARRTAAQGDRRVTIRYIVTNRGNRRLYDVRITDPLTAREGIDCAGGRPVVPRLDPGRSAGCRAVLRRAPGAYTGAGVAEGGDRISTLGRHGEAAPPPRLLARASARFVIPAVPRPPAPSHQPTRPPAPDVPNPPGVPPVPAAPEPPAGPPAPAVPVAPGVPVQPPGVPPVPPGAVFPPPPPAALVPGLVAAPPGTDPAGAAAVAPPGQQQPPGARPPAARPPSKQSPSKQPPAERHPSFLSRLYRQGEGPTGLGLVAALFLVMIPAAIAAAVLGSRRG